jgi:hypothetical protein
MDGVQRRSNASQRPRAPPAPRHLREKRWARVARRAKRAGACGDRVLSRYISCDHCATGRGVPAIRRACVLPPVHFGHVSDVLDARLPMSPATRADGGVPGSFRQLVCPQMARLAEGPWHVSNCTSTRKCCTTAGETHHQWRQNNHVKRVDSARRWLKITYIDAYGADRACHPPPPLGVRSSLLRWTMRLPHAARHSKPRSAAYRVPRGVCQDSVS